MNYSWIWGAFNIFPPAHSSSVVAFSWSTHQLWKSNELGCQHLDWMLTITQTAHHALCHTFEGRRTDTSQCSVFVPWGTQTSIYYSTVCMSWLKWLRFLSNSDPVFKAVTSGFNLLNRQRQQIPAKKGPWNCPCCLPYSSVQSLNQKKQFLHSGLSVRIIKDPKGCAGSVQTQAQAWKIKVMEMWPSSEEEPQCPHGIQCRVASTEIHVDKKDKPPSLFIHKWSFNSIVLIISGLL